MLLPDGKATVSRVEAVIFDAMFTVIEPKIPRFYYILKIFEDVLGIRVHPRLLAHYLRESEQVFDAVTDYKREWIERNCYIASRLLGRTMADIDPQIGFEVHRRTVSGSVFGDDGVPKDDGYYEVKPVMRNLLILLTSLQNPPRLVIASNQYEDFLVRMIDQLDLRSFFKTRVFTSEKLGTSKPNPDFFYKIMRGLSLQPDQMLIVGNSAKRDLPPAKFLEIPICLYDRRGKLDLLPEPNVAVVRTIAEMQDWLLSRLIPGWVQKEEEPIESLIS